MGLLFFVHKVNNNSKTVCSNVDFDALTFSENSAVNEFISEKYEKNIILHIHRTLNLRNIKNTSTI